MGWRYAISAPVGLPGDAARNRDSRHAVERHSGGLSSRLNWPRAAVLGANDGIVSVAGIVLGVAGPPRREAPYSPLGRRAWWPARCRWRSANMCRCRVSETARSRCSPGNGESCGRCQRGVGRTGGDIRGQGRLSADGRTSRRRIAAWPRRFSRPLQAAAASAASFTVGSLLPLLAIWWPPAMFRLPVTFVAVLIALGWRVRSAHVSEGATSAAPCCRWWSAARTSIANLYRSSAVRHRRQPSTRSLVFSS